MDREIDIGFVKDETPFHDLKSVRVHSDEMICSLTAPSPHRAFSGAGGRSRKRAVCRAHLCSTTEQKILRLFEAHGTR